MDSTNPPNYFHYITIRNEQKSIGIRFIFDLLFFSKHTLT